MTKRMHRLTRTLAGVLGSSLLAVGLVACAPSQPSHNDKIKIVASTSVWGSIAAAIGGDKVQVTSLVHNPNQDPHSFEASVRDQAAVNNADLVLVTGNGYDSFMTPLIAASNQPASHIIKLAAGEKTVKTANGIKVDDPHVWYDLALVGKIATTIETKLETLAPSEASTFKASSSKFQTGLAKLQERQFKVGHIKRRCYPQANPDNSLCEQQNLTPIFQPEAVGLRLIADFAIDYTPKQVRLAAQNETDISLQQMAVSKSIFDGTALDSKGYSLLPLRWLVLNAQQSTAQTLQFVSWAKNGYTKVVTFSETLPAGETYLTWMAANLKQLEQLRLTEYSSML